MGGQTILSFWDELFYLRDENTLVQILQPKNYFESSHPKRLVIELCWYIRMLKSI